MTAEQRHEYTVSDLTTRLLHWINFARVIALVFTGNLHARWCTLSASIAMPDRIHHIQRKQTLHDKAANMEHPI
jgi:Ni,Fe-hydrogenase I cytochrome b subunit